MDFCNSIYGSGTHDGKVWGGVLGGGGAKCPYGAWTEQLQFVFFGHFQDIVKPIDPKLSEWRCQMRGRALDEFGLHGCKGAGLMTAYLKGL